MLHVTVGALFNISTSRPAPNVVCCGHFDFERRFWPRRHALFRQLNLEKCHVMCLLHFDFHICFEPGPVPFLDLSTSKSGPSIWCFLHVLVSIPASSHNGVQFWISHLLDGSTPAALTNLLFNHPYSQNIGKTTLLPFRVP